MIEGNAGREPSLAAVLRAAAYGETAASVAVDSPSGATLTYRDLQEITSWIGRLLDGLDVQPSDRVMVTTARSADMAVTLLGAATRAVAVPFNPALTAYECRALFAQVRPAALIMRQGEFLSAAEIARQVGVPILQLSLEWGSHIGAKAGKRTDEPHQSDPNSLLRETALLLRSSGTTGSPRLIPLSHRNVLAAARATAEAYQLTRDDHRLNVMPLHHVQGSVGTVVAALVSGSRVTYCDDAPAGGTVLDHMEACRSTWFSASPTVYRGVLDEARRRPRGSLPRLRFLRVGSAPLPARLMFDLEDAFQTPVIESYGMTEAHQVASNPMPPGQRRAGTVGLPTGSSVGIFSPSGTPLPAGESGEIWIHGENVAAGFITDQLNVDRSDHFGVWLRTGDVGSFSEDGYLRIDGRAKEMINRGGEKIAPREVEEALVGHRSVRAAVAFGIEHPTLIEEVAATVQLAEGGEVSERELRLFAFSRLTSTSVPRRILFVPSLPTGPTGKLQRASVIASSRAILVAESKRRRKSMEDAQPSDDAALLEVALIQIWKRLLGNDQIGYEDDFFFLGGDSLSGEKLLATVRRVFQVDLPRLSIYDRANTVRSMARTINEIREQEESKRSV